MPPLSMQILRNFNGNIVLSGTGLWFPLIMALINPYHCCCCCSVTQSCPTLCNPMDCSTPGFPVLHCPLEFAQRHVHWLVMPSNYLILCHPILFLPSIFLRIRVFSNELALCIWWTVYSSFNCSISPFNEYSGLIYFRIDWFDLLAVQGTLKTFSNTTVRNHQFFGAQPSLWSNFHISRWLLEKP